jgi:hypothetical protein
LSVGVFLLYLALATTLILVERKKSGANLLLLPITAGVQKPAQGEDDESFTGRWHSSAVDHSGYDLE